MTAQPGSPAQLGADNVIRFLDVDHFLRELAGNLGRGRAFVRSRRNFAVKSRVTVEVEAPGVSWRVSGEASVVFIRDGFVGLEFLDFENRMLPELDRLGGAAEASLLAPVGGERTVIASFPSLADLSPSEDEVTGEIKLPSLDSNSVVDIDSVAIASESEPDPDLPTLGSASIDPSQLDEGPVISQASVWRVRPEPKADKPEAERAERLDRRRPVPRRPVPKEPERRSEGNLNALPEPEPRQETEPRAEQRASILDAPTTAGASPFLEVPHVLDTGDRMEADAAALLFEASASSQGMSAESAREILSLEVPDLPSDALLAEPLPLEEPASEMEATRDMVAADLDLSAAPAPVLMAPEPEPEPEPQTLPKTEAILDPEPAPEPAVPTAPAPPPIALFGLESLDDRALPFPRATPGGVVRLTDATDLLGLYFSQVRHGWLTVLGGPEADLGQTVNLKLIGPTVIALPAVIHTRVGPWLTLQIPDSAPLMALLKDAADRWRPSLEPFLGQGAPNVAAPVIAPAAPVITPVVAPPPALVIEALPESALEIVAPPPPPPEPEDDLPVEVPRLIGEHVVFRRRKDLRHELNVNLKNGGLFVESPPLPIRTKRRLKIRISAQELPVHLETDVVFANGGRVGFSVSNAADVLSKLENWLDAKPEPKPEAKPEPKLSEPIDLRDDAGEKRGDPEDFSQDQIAPSDDLPGLSAFNGQIEEPLMVGQVLDLESKRLTETSQLGRTSVLQLFDYLMHHQARGVLTLTSGAAKRVIWCHEGHVAFMIAQPHDDASSLGRLLITQKKLGDASLRDAMDKARAAGKPLGRVLVALGMVKKADLSATIREQVRLWMDETLGWRKGHYEWTGWTEPPGEADVVLTRGQNIIARHLKGRFEALNLAEIEALFGKNMSRSVAAPESLEPISLLLQLQPRELRFLEVQVDGQRTIHDAVVGSPIGRLASLRLLALCLAMGLARFVDGSGRVSRENTRVHAESSAYVRLKKELSDRLTLMKDMNHFEVLGVHWSAHPRTYKAAWEKAKSEFNFAKPPLKEAPEEVIRLAKGLVNILDESFSVLSDPNKRIEYRKKLFKGTEHKYAADMLVKQGEVALMRGDRMGAIEMLETAVELDPSPRNRQLLGTAREGRS